jgi:hypothetical protein
VDWSFWISVAGLIVSIAGFGFTIWQVIKSRKAAEEAKDIAREAINRIGSQLIFTHITATIRLIQDVRNFCRLKQWDRAIDRCEEVRIRLADFVDDPKLQDREQREISIAIDDLTLIIQHIESIVRNKKPLELEMGMEIILHNMVVMLGKVNGRMRALAMEV